MVGGREVDGGHLVGMILVLFDLVQLLGCPELTAQHLVAQFGALGIEGEQSKSSTTRRSDETAASRKVRLFEERLFGALVQLFDVVGHSVQVAEDFRWWSGARLNLSIRRVRTE